MANLTNKELETFKILVRLGDSKELALKTVLSERQKQTNNQFYINGYER